MASYLLYQHPVIDLDWTHHNMVRDEEAFGSRLRERIEGVYANGGVMLPIDPHDQQRFLCSLYSIVRRRRPRRVIQTGTFTGFSTVAMALAMADTGNDGIIDTIDPEPALYGFAEHPTKTARFVVGMNDFRDRVRFWTGYSVKAWRSPRQDYPDVREGLLADLGRSKDVDLLVVDGDHSYAGAYWDLEIGFRTLSADGPRLIFVHDYYGIATVRQAVQDWCDRHAGEIQFRSEQGECGIALIECAADLVRRETFSTVDYRSLVAATALPPRYAIKKTL